MSDQVPAPSTDFKVGCVLPFKNTMIVLRVLREKVTKMAHERYRVILGVNDMGDEANPEPTPEEVELRETMGMITKVVQAMVREDTTKEVNNAWIGFVASGLDPETNRPLDPQDHFDAYVDKSVLDKDRSEFVQAWTYKSDLVKPAKLAPATGE